MLLERENDSVLTFAAKNDDFRPSFGGQKGRTVETCGPQTVSRGKQTATFFRDASE